MALRSPVVLGKGPESLRKPRRIPGSRVPSRLPREGYPFCPPSRGDPIKIGPLARRGTSFRGPHAIYYVTRRGSFHGRVLRKRWRKGKARCETTSSNTDPGKIMLMLLRPRNPYTWLSFSLCQGGAMVLSRFPAWSLLWVTFTQVFEGLREPHSGARGGKRWEEIRTVKNAARWSGDDITYISWWLSVC